MTLKTVVCFNKVWDGGNLKMKKEREKKKNEKNEKNGNKMKKKTPPSAPTGKGGEEGERGWCVWGEEAGRVGGGREGAWVGPGGLKICGVTNQNVD